MIWQGSFSFCRHVEIDNLRHFLAVKVFLSIFFHAPNGKTSTKILISCSFI